METFMKVILIMIILREKVNLKDLMVFYIKEIGKKDYKVVKDQNNGQIIQFIKEIIKMVKNMVKVYIHGMMVLLIMEIGKMEKLMVLVR